MLDSMTRKPVGSVSELCGPWRVGVWMISNWPSADLRSNGGKWGGVVSGLIVISMRRETGLWGYCFDKARPHAPSSPGADCDVGISMLLGKSE